MGTHIPTFFSKKNAVSRFLDICHLDPRSTASYNFTFFKCKISYCYHLLNATKLIMSLPTSTSNVKVSFLSRMSEKNFHLFENVTAKGTKIRSATSSLLKNLKHHAALLLFKDKNFRAIFPIIFCRKVFAIFIQQHLDFQNFFTCS